MADKDAAPGSSEDKLIELEQRIKKLEDAVFGGGGPTYTTDRLLGLEQAVTDISARYVTQDELDQAYRILGTWVDQGELGTWPGQGDPGSWPGPTN